MQRPRLLFLLALVGAVAAGCDDDLTSPTRIPGPNTVISDGATNGISADVFFLPPLVPNPSGSSFFDAGEFNPNLTSAVIRVCHMAGNVCTPVARFGAGPGVTGPITISLQDEHYLALWHTDQSNPALIPGEEYRIQVFADADVSGEPVAWADVEVAATGRELRNIDTDQTIALLDGRTLPIKVRFENGLRCTTDKCLTRRVDATGSTLVLQSGEGALILQEGWLPPNVPEVTVTVQWEPTVALDQCVQREGHVGRGLIAQTRACLQITTDPELTPGEATGIQEPAFVFICKPQPTGLSEELEELLQIIKADAGRPLQALRDVDHATLIQLGFTPTCAGETPGPIGAAPSSGLLHFASSGVRSIADFVTRTFSVRSLHAIDLGQGGEIIRFDGFSRFTLGVPANLTASGEVPGQATVGEPVTLSTTLLGQSHHEPGDVVTEGIADVDVVFTITAGDGSLSDPDDELDGGSTTITKATGATGVSSLTLFPGEGANTITAVAMQNGEPVSDVVTFSVEGVPPLEGSIEFRIQPSNVIATEPIAPAVVIAVLDETGALLTDRIVSVTFGNAPDNPSSCLIHQSRTLAFDGIATLSNVITNGGCSGARLAVTAGAQGYEFPIVLSEPFEIFDIGGQGTAALDGVVGVEEWSGANCLSFDARVPEGGTTPARLCAMNDQERLFLLVRFERSTDFGSSVNFQFDASGDGQIGSLDDHVVFRQPAMTIEDNHFFDNEVSETCPVNSLCTRSDASAGGSTNFVGAFTNNETESVFEVAHPLCSDDAFDICLSSSSVIEFILGLNIFDAEGAFERTFYRTGNLRLFIK